MMENKMQLTFLSKSANEAFARSAVAAFISQLDPTLEELADIKTAVSEAVTNAIVHGYGHGYGTITVSCELYKDKKVIIIIRDEGQGIEDVKLAMQPLYTKSSDMERSGMGFTVMETFMESIDVRSQPGLGTTITLTKQIDGDKPSC